MANDNLFLQNCWYVGAHIGELDDQATVARRVLGRPLLFYLTKDSGPVAMLDRCPHRLVPLSAGGRDGDTIRCGYHGLVFGSDGRCVHIPGQAAIPSNAVVPTFPAVLRYGYLWVWAGDAAQADPATIPVLAGLGDAAWDVALGYSHFGADYRLLTDNLLDLSHESYIHEATIGNEAAETIADYPVQIDVREGELLAHREMLNIDSPPYFRMMLGNDARIDRLQTAAFRAPSFNRTDVAAWPVGTPREAAYASHVHHLLTPETERSTHYFWAMARNYRVGEAALTENIRQALASTFEEDRDMLEMQQHELDRSNATLPGFAVKLDDAPLRARRMLRTAIRGEQATAAPATAV